MELPIYPPNQLWNNTSINIKWGLQTVAPPDPQYGFPLNAGGHDSIFGVTGFDVTAVWLWNDENEQLPGFGVGSDPSMPTSLFELYVNDDGNYAIRTTPQNPING